jgi:hypothetical protein
MAKKKIGKRKKQCQTYSLNKTREKNKLKRVRKHLIKFPADLIAVKKATELEKIR